MLSLIRRLSVVALVLCLLVSCSTTKESEIYNPHTVDQDKALEDWKLTTLIAKGDEEKSRPVPYVIDGLSSGEKLVLISGSGEESEIEIEDESVEIYNLLLGEYYSWTVFDKNGKIIKEGEFTVSSLPPRNIYVDGITNVRDLGGWKRDNGEVVKQGLIYRSARLNENESDEVLLSDEGRETLLSLGIKSEIDLRKTVDNENGGITESPIGENVNYYSIPFETGGGYLQKNLTSFPALFSILGEEENYPLLFHCSIGTDRTGAVSFVLLSLLGVTEDDLYRDYLFSNFGYIEGIRRKSAIDDYLMYIERYKGETRKEKVYSMLIENGVEKKDIDSFVSIITDNDYLSKGEGK